MTETNVQVQEQPNTPVVEADPDAERYAALANELESDESERVEEDAAPAEKPEQAGDDKAAKPDAKAKEAEQAEKPKPTVEEIEQNYKNSQAALREAREEAKLAKTQLAEFNKAIAELRANREAKEAPKVPDVNDDPVGYFKHQLAEMQVKLDEATTGTKKTAEQIEAQQRQTQFWNAVIQSETEFRGTNEDYDAACQHLESGRVAELKVMYPDDSPKAQALAEQYGLPSVEALREAVLNQDRMNVAVQAMQLGMSPAQMYYELAKSRGYARAEAAKPNGHDKREKAEQVIETARRGQKAAKSISGGEGGTADNPLAITDLIDLYDEDPDEADKVFEKMRKQGLLG